ncbi:MAG: branched-chain amino acid transport system ATP-binding protein [Actinomycetota bacterium]
MNPDESDRLPEPLELRHVRAGYGRIDVVHDVDIAVRRGEVCALLGPNGAGKTTTLGVMSGLITPTRGCRHAYGRHVNNATAAELSRIGICHVREGRSVFPNLSVEDNLVVASSSGAPIDRLREVAYTLFPVLKTRRSVMAGNLSGGEKQMLSLARGLGTDPAVLLVDELSMGLAPLIVDQLYEAVAEVAQVGVSVLVVEQFASIGLKYASHAYVMAHGSLTYSGPSNGALDAVHAAYLGVSA